MTIHNFQNYILKDTSASILVAPSCSTLWNHFLSVAGYQVMTFMWRDPLGKELRPPTNIHVNDLRSRYSSPWRDCSQVNSLTTASWETQSQNHPTKLLLDSWPSETTWNNTYLLFYYAKYLHSYRIIDN